MCSFDADTAVLMADGTTKPVKDIKVGDQVLATDPATGQQGPRTVTALWIHQDTLTDLQTEDGTITTTEDHPFWNHTDQQWQPAEALDPGDQLHSTAHHLPRVVGLATGTQRNDLAYNLTVADIHTYYVLAGNTPVLVHNTGPCRTMPAGDLVKSRTSHPIDPDYIKELDGSLSDADLIKSLNDPTYGDSATMTRGGQIVDAHHRIYLLEQRILQGRIDPNTPISFRFTDEAH